jgi:hypothetical protein
MAKDAIFEHAQQLIESKATSINAVASTFGRVEFKRGSLNLDYGGGRFESATKALADKGVDNVVYDPFNRSIAHNLGARLALARRGGADTVTVNNVLNVIAEDQALREVVEQAANGLREGGTAYFLIYESDGCGEPCQTNKGFQRRQKAAAYGNFLAERFDSVERKANLWVAKGPKKSERSLFDLARVEAEILAQAKALGAPMPHAKLGVGKLIGGRLYLHRSAWDALPQEPLAKALARLPEGFEPAVAKWDAKTGCFSFMESSGFAIEEEPAIERSAKVFPNGMVSLSKAKSDPQIYHHKWSFARPESCGFDYYASVLRTIEWARVPCDRAVIGTRSRWEADVVWPHLGGRGARGPKTEVKGAAPKSRQG